MTSTEAAEPARDGTGQAPARSSTARRDALWALGVTLCGGVAFTTLDVAERVVPWLTRLEPYELDDLLLTAGLALGAALWFAQRRYAESRARYAALLRSEAERDGYLKRLEDLSAELLRADAEQRHELASALHDRVGQPLYAARLQLELAAGADTGAPSPALEQAHVLVSEAMAASKDLTVELNPPVLHDLGLREALRWLLPRLEARFGFRAELDDDPAWSAVEPRHQEAVFRSLAELLVNAGKHAQARAVRVCVRREPERRLRLSVEDDGVGFDAAARPREGYGLFSIERRLACMNGRLELRTAPGAGTCAVLHLRADG